MTGTGLVIVVPHPPIAVPQVGGRRSEVTRDTTASIALAGALLRSYEPDLIVLMSPHAPAARDGFLVDDSETLEGSLRDFGDPRMLRFTGDPAFAHSLIDASEGEGITASARSDFSGADAGMLDHGCLVPLHLLSPVPDVGLIIVSLSGLPLAAHREFGQVIANTARDRGRRAAFIASGDMSHRLTPDAPAGFDARAEEFDRVVRELVAAGRFADLVDIDSELRERAGECGLRSLVTGGGFLGCDMVPSRVLSYEGPWGVGYLTAVAGADAVGLLEAHREPPDADETAAEGDEHHAPESEIVRLARCAVRDWVTTCRPLESPELHGEYPRRAGAFVSLHSHGCLRGCIGTIAPIRDSLADEVACNAVEACSRDPRFPPVDVDELDDLEISVDVLGAPEPCTFEELDPREYGVIVTKGFRRGLLLPDLEGVDDAESQVSIAAQKAGLSSLDGIHLERFRVHRYT